MIAAKAEHWDIIKSGDGIGIVLTHNRFGTLVWFGYHKRYEINSMEDIEVIGNISGIVDTIVKRAKKDYTFE